MDIPKTAPDQIVARLSERFDEIMRERGWRFASIQRVGEGLIVQAYGKHGDWGVVNSMTDAWTHDPDREAALKQLADSLENHALENPWKAPGEERDD